VEQSPSETPQQRRERAIAKMKEVYGWDFQDGTGDFWAITADHLFADIWSRDGLDIGQRRMLPHRRTCRSQQA